MLKWIARRLPPTIQDKIRSVRDGVLGVAPATAPPPPKVLGPSPLSLDGLIELVASQEGWKNTTDAARIDQAFTAASLRPELYRALDLEYARRDMAASVAYQRLCAARLLGLGQTADAFDRLREIAQSSGSCVDFIMAARCLMRPAGSERALLDYLRTGESQFGREPLFYLHLATCHFVLGETDVANEVLEAHRVEWEPILGLGSEAALHLEAELKSALSEGTAYRRTHYDETIYDESGIWRYWEQYYTDMNLDPPTLMFGWLAANYERFMEDAVADGGLTSLVDFGVMCGQPHFNVARRHPQLKIFGVDRQLTTAELNERTFGKGANLEFVADEIEGFLTSGRDLTGSGLFHARTATLVYPDKIRNLYRMAHEAGVDRIVLFENFSLSRSAGRFLDFTDFDADAVTFKNFQFIHNYPRLLEEAGYLVERENRLFTPVVSPFDAEDICSTHVHLVASRH